MIRDLPSDPEALLFTHEAAELLGLSERTLQAYRQKGDGPVFFKMGVSVRYARRELIEWAKGHKVQPKPRRRSCSK